MQTKYSKDKVVSAVLDFIKDTSDESVVNDVANEINNISIKNLKSKVAYVYTTFYLPDDIKNTIKKKLEEVSGREIQLRNTVNKNLLGGIKIKVGDWVYDHSISGQIESLKEEIYGAI